MDEHWSDSPEVFLEAIAAIKNKFPDSAPADVLARALEKGIGLGAENASVFGRTLTMVVGQLQGVPPNVKIDSSDIRRAAAALNACVAVDYSYDLDYLAGYAQQDPKKIYIDKGFTRKDVAPYLVVHEAVEKCLLDYVHFSDRAYQRAHQVAQYIEHAAVEAAGIAWDDYQHKIMPPEIERVTQKIRQKQMKSVPPDLDLTPYIDTHDPDIKEIEALMRSGHFTVSPIGGQIYHLQFADAKRMARTLMRFEEFYESKKFKGTYFTREEFEQWYQETHGAAYEDHWAEGFNFPSSVLEPFYDGHFSPLTIDEQQVLNFFRDKRSAPFYVIVTAGNSTHDNLSHELAHAFYFVNAGYKKEVGAVLAGADLAPLKRFLQTDPGYGMYHELVLDDECQAYLSQSSEELREHGFDIAPYAETAALLQEIYKKYAGIMGLP